MFDYLWLFCALVWIYLATDNSWNSLSTAGDKIWSITTFHHISNDETSGHFVKVGIFDYSWRRKFSADTLISHLCVIFMIFMGKLRTQIFQAKCNYLFLISLNNWVKQQKIFSSFFIGQRSFFGFFKILLLILKLFKVNYKAIMLIKSHTKRYQLIAETDLWYGESIKVINQTVKPNILPTKNTSSESSYFSYFYKIQLQ